MSREYVQFNNDGSDKMEQRKARLFENIKFPYILTIYFIEEHPIIIRCREALYIYNGKYYSLLTVDEFKKILHKWIAKWGLFALWTKSKIDTIYDSLMSTAEVKEVDRMNSDDDFLCVNNGVVNIKTLELQPHSPDFYFDSLLNIDYSPNNGDCPIFNGYLDSVFNGDNETIQNIIRLGGYLLDPNCKAGKMFMFDGDGAAGKSTLIDTFSLFFDESQITALSLETLSETGYNREKLINSRVNFAAEQKRGYLDADEIKKIVTGDYMDIQRKYKGSVTVRAKCKIIVACNGRPKFADNSEGIFRRIIIFRFKNMYKPKHEYDKIDTKFRKNIYVKDPTLFSKIAAEKSAIFNLFLYGLKELRDNNYEFIESLDSEKALIEFKKENDTVREFLEENYTVDDSFLTPIKEIFMHYRLWYRDNVQDVGAIKFRTNEMGRRLREILRVEPHEEKMNWYNRETGKYERLTSYPLRLIDDNNISFETNEESFETNEEPNEPQQSSLI